MRWKHAICVFWSANAAFKVQVRLRNPLVLRHHDLQMPLHSPLSPERTQPRWPTIVVGVAILGSWCGLTIGHRGPPVGVTIVLLAVVSCWHSSFQHELVHARLTRRPGLQALIGTFTVNLWFPFGDYRQLHLRHHRDESLTDPIDDPESWYVTEGAWATASRPTHTILRANRTLLGRLVVGPFLAVGSHAAWVFGEFAAGSATRRRAWSHHLLAVAITLLWVHDVAEMPIWQYALGAVWGGTVLTLVRSFPEHRWAPDPAGRSAVVRSGPLVSLLFLHNNLHHAHHARPSVPWFGIPAVARELMSDEVARDGAGWYRGYGEVARRYFFHPFGTPVHPTPQDSRR